MLVPFLNLIMETIFFLVGHPCYGDPLLSHECYMSCSYRYKMIKTMKWVDEVSHVTIP